MGKNKVQPYQLFIRDRYNQMKRAGQEVVFGSLYQALGPEWQAMSQEQKNRYKERASGNVPTTAPSTPQSNPNKQPNREFKPSTSSFTPSDNLDGQSHDLDRKIKVDVKPVIKEERGVKRELEVDVAAGHQDQEHEQPKKKRQGVQGFGIPNWRNIKNSSQPDADRYFDYHLVKLREQCESIVATQHRKILTLPLHTFSCNVLCKHKKDGTEIKYIPIEIAMTTYSIKSGRLKPPYHVIIDAGPPPRNYWGDTHDHLTNTHKIEVTQDGVYPPEARKDYRLIYKEMIKYVKNGERTILVADNYDLEQVRKSIEWVYEMATLDSEDEVVTLPKPATWTILPLVDFVAAAYNFVYVHMLHYPLPKFTLHYYLRVRLETSIWDYDTSLMCPYHAREDNQTKWCAQNCAVRVINALQLTFEEIFQNYTTAEQAEAISKQPNNGSGEQANLNPTTDPNAGSSTRPTPVQQRQQPLHMPEETEPPPVFEEMARREELRRQREELFRNPPPPPGNYAYDVPVRAQDSNQIKAIESAQHLLDKLDPRLRRAANAEGQQRSNPD